MLRFLLLVIAFYLVFRIILRVAKTVYRAFVGGDESPRVHQQSPHPREKVEYRDVEDAKFKDVNDASSEEQK